MKPNCCPRPSVFLFYTQGSWIQLSEYRVSYLINSTLQKLNNGPTFSCSYHQVVLTSKAPSRHRAWLGGGVKLQTFVPGTRKRFAELASCFFENLNNWLGFPFFSTDSVFHLSVYLWAEGFWFEDLLLFCHSEEGRRSLNWVPVFYLCKMITWPRDQLSR